MEKKKPHRTKGALMIQRTKQELKDEIEKHKQTIQHLTQKIQETHERIESNYSNSRNQFIKVKSVEGQKQYINSSLIKSIQDSELTPNTLITYYDNEGLLVTNSIEALVTQLNFLT